MQTNRQDIAAVNMAKCPEWDSLNHLRLMMALEQQFEIQIQPKQMSELITLAAIVTFLTKKNIT